MERSDEEIVTDELTSTSSETAAVDGLADTATDRSVDAESGSLSDRLGGLFSLKAFLLSTLLLGVGVVGGGAIPLIGTIGSLAGLFAASFGIGLLTSERQYLETAVAGGVIVGVSFATSLLTTAVLPVGVDFFQQYGLAFAGLGVAVGAVVSVLGCYFGRDLRNGLTQEI